MDESGNIQMVNISQKRVTQRYARARCIVRMKPETLRAIGGGEMEKGDVFTTAKIAGIQAAKKVDELIQKVTGCSLEEAQEQRERWEELEFLGYDKDGFLCWFNPLGDEKTK